MKTSPTPDQIRTARHRANLTQDEAAQLVYYHRNSWENWENGRVNMHPSAWELFTIKVKALK